MDPRIQALCEAIYRIDLSREKEPVELFCDPEYWSWLAIQQDDILSGVPMVSLHWPKHDDAGEPLYIIKACVVKRCLSWDCKRPYFLTNTDRKIPIYLEQPPYKRPRYYPGGRVEMEAIECCRCHPLDRRGPLGGVCCCGKAIPGDAREIPSHGIAQ